MPCSLTKRFATEPFEPHADTIVKGGRDVHYGHKITLTTGRQSVLSI
ncbi:hypothetical protein X760_32345 [Mesorhizobium sp. LSHC422A00]|nr:hypothetical protein X762_31155 [Mesorhizobium sp. LSHC426A00]ESX43321.1 hypothetical protein X764_08860 [Mesorhizobium sp. LSHC440A00]ESX49741.1 hypothetical protein X760_32345 [Mesorhizobium sp. LSHC422A00]